jgi:hypothetical protein
MQEKWQEIERDETLGASGGGWCRQELLGRPATAAPAWEVGPLKVDERRPPPSLLP